MDAGWRYLGSSRSGSAGRSPARSSPGSPGRARRSSRRSSSDGPSTPASSHGSRSALWWSCAALVALGAIEAVAGGSRHYFAIRNRALADADVRDGIFRRALELDARYHDRVGAGELISRASNDAELVARLFDAIGHTVGYILTIFGASVVLFVIDWRLALAVLAPLPLLSVGFGRYSKRYAERTKVNQEQLGEPTALAEETIAGIRVVKGLGAGDALAARFRRQSDEVVETALAVADVDAVFLPALEALPLIGILVVLWYGAHRVADRRHHDRHVRALHVLPRAARQPAADDRAARQHGAARRCRGAPRRRRAARRAGRRRIGAACGRSRSGRTFASRTCASRTATSGRSSTASTLDIPAGTSLALVGATGSGKSTVAALARPLLRPERRARDDRRRRRARAPPRRASPRRRARLRGDVPLRRHGARQRRLRLTRGGRRRDPAGDAARRRGGVRRRSARGVRDRARRARLLAVRRTAPADRDRTCDPRRPARADPRRRDLGGRRDEGARDPRGARRGDGRAHDARDRPPAGDDRARRPGGGRRRRAGRRAGAHAELLARSPRYRELLALAGAEAAA